MSVAPKIDSQLSPTLIPKELNTPNKDRPGISKTVFTHVSTLQHLLTDWAKSRDNGTKSCRAIVALRLHECTDEYYPSQLKPLMEILVECTETLKGVVEGIEPLSIALRALASLQPTDEPIICTWSATQIAVQVDSILHDLNTELRLKQLVTEHIAHCRDENLIEVYASSWELDVFNGGTAASYLRAELGLPTYTK